MSLQNLTRQVFSLLTLTALAAVAEPAPLHVPTPRLVKDLIPGEDATFYPSDPRIAAAGNRVFFTQQRLETGSELWVSDGTAKSTRMVKDIYPGIETSGITEMVMSANKLFFTANDGIHGRELWVSDGTAANTRMVADLFSGPGYVTAPFALRAFKNGVVFAAEADVGGLSLWFTDGTAANTRPLKSLNWYSLQAENLNRHRTTVTSTHVYFTTNEDTPQGEVTSLWRTDGTFKGTTRITDLPEAEVPVFFGAAGNLAYFGVANDAEAYLWRTDGTAAGTLRLLDLKDGAENVPIYGFNALGNKAYFVDGQRRALWQSDGSLAGTRRILDAQTGQTIEDPVVVGSQLLFSTLRSDTELPGRVWLLNPTSMKLTRVSDSLSPIRDLISNGKQAWYSRAESADRGLFFFNGSKEILQDQVTMGWTGSVATSSGLFVAAWRSPNQVGIWKVSHQPSQLPVLIAPVLQKKDANSSMPNSFVSCGGKQYLIAQGVNDTQLWVTDGTEAGTRLLNTAVGGYEITSLTPGPNGVLLFSSSSSLWRTDGTEAGTYNLGAAQPESLTLMPDGIVLFNAVTTEHGRELWRTDGTQAGTSMVHDFYTGAASGFGLGMTSFQGKLLLFAQTARGVGLWSANDNLASPDFVSHPYYIYESKEAAFVPFGDSLYFLARPYINPTIKPMTLMKLQVINGEVVITQVSDGGFFKAWSLTVARDPSQPGHPEQLYFLSNALPHAGQNEVCRCDGVNAPVVLTTPTTLPIQSQPEEFYHSRGYLVIRSMNDYATSLNGGKIWVPSSSGDSLTLLATGSLVATNDRGVCYAVSDRNREIPSELNWIQLDGSGLTRVMTAAAGSAFRAIQTLDHTVFFELEGSIGRFSVLGMSGGTAETTVIIPGLGHTAYTSLLWEAGVTGHTLYLSGHSLQGPGTASIGEELYALDLTPPALTFTQVTGAGSPQPLIDDDTVSIIQAVGQSRTVTLRITNAGLTKVSDLTLSAPVPALTGVTFDLTSMGDLAPGQTVQVPITFTPTSVGYQEGELTVSASGLPTTELDLVVAGLGGDSPPALGAMPRFVFLASGMDFHATPDYIVAGSSPNYIWRKDTQNVGTEAELHIPDVKPGHAGAYRLTVRNSSGGSSLESDPVNLAVIYQPAPVSQTVPEGKKLSLETRLYAPKDTTAQYQWLRNGIPLSDIDRTRGSRTATLDITDIRPFEAGTYTCAVTLTWDGITRTQSLSTEISILAKPAWSPEESTLQDFGTVLIGQQVSTEPVTFDRANTITVKGLPPGLSYQSISKRITGKATKVGSYTIAFTGTNSAGAVVKTLTLRVLPAVKTGSYDGLVERIPLGETTPGLGSRVLFSATTAGTVSGQLFHDGKVYRFSGLPVTQPGQPDAENTLPVKIAIARGKDQPGLELTFQTGSTFSLSLKDDLTSTTTAGQLRRPHYSATSPVPAGAVGPCVLHLESTPQGLKGRGYATATLAKTGVLIWKGKLADGTAFTGSSALVKGPLESETAFAIHLNLYKGTGTVNGWVNLPVPTDDRATVNMIGNLTWNKAALPPNSKDRNYKDGIPLHPLRLFGSSYRAPAKDQFLFTGLSAAGDALLSMRASLVPEGTPQLTQSFDLNGKHKALLPALTTAGTFLKTLTFDAKQGSFKGTVVIANADPKLVRTAAIEGIIDPYINGIGYGFCLLPDLPSAGPPATTLTTSPLKSATVEIRP